MYLGFTAALVLITAALQLWKDERDPIKNKKRIILNIKKRITNRRREIKLLESRLKKALHDGDEKEVQYILAKRNKVLKEIKAEMDSLELTLEEAKEELEDKKQELVDKKKKDK